MARSRARARLTFSSHGHRLGRCRVNRSSLRTWPHLKLRRKAPRVEGAFLRSRERRPSCRCATRRRRRCSRRQPARKRPASLSCRRGWPGPAHRPGPGAAVPIGKGRGAGPKVAGRSRPALATRRWSSKVIWMRSGWWPGSIYWVLLVLGSVCCYKTIIPEAQEHFLTHSTRRDTHLFGGFGLRLEELVWAQLHGHSSLIIC